MSTGANRQPAIAAAVTTTLKLAIGLGESRIEGPLPLLTPSAALSSVGSGMSRSAERQLRVHVSIVFNNTPYMKVEFVPFQTPNADSLFQSCEMTSTIESA